MNKKFSFLISFVVAWQTCFAAAPSNPPFIIGAYYENWSQFRPASGDRKPFSIDLIDPSLISDLYYAFAIFGFKTSFNNEGQSALTGDFKIMPIYPNEQKVLYNQIQDLKRKTGGRLRLFLSIGGANFNNPNEPLIGKWTHKLYSQMVANPKSRKEFIDSAIDYAHQFGFDGVDIDWEYPGDLKKGGSEEDLKNCLVFFEECSKAFHQAQPPLLLSFAIPPAVPGGMSEEYQENPDRYYQWLAKCAQFVDRMNVMAYNYHTPFDTSKITGANAPLSQDSHTLLSVSQTLNNYLNNGVPASKMLLGLSLYGWSYENVSNLRGNDSRPRKIFQTVGPPGPSTRKPGFLAYYEIVDKIEQERLRLKIDSITHTAYAYDTGNPNQWVSFELPETIAMKVKLAKQRGLAGVVFWAIDLDEYQWEPNYPNIRRALKTIRNTSSSN